MGRKSRPESNWKLTQLEVVFLEAENQHLKFENEVEKLESAQKEFTAVISKAPVAEKALENAAYTKLVEEL